MALPTLASVADVEARTGETYAGAALTKVQALLRDASAAVRRATRQTISLVEDDEIVLAGDGSTLMVLPERPVVAVAGVAVAGRAVTGWTNTSRGLVGLPWGPGDFTVTYTHGYDEIPDDVVAVVCALVIRALTLTPGVRSTSNTIGDYSESVTFAGDVPGADPMALTDAERESLRFLSGPRARSVALS